MIAYRREIDGLRALAVVPVVLFHAGLEFFSGGFVGVDVFFVISGYLITSILLSQIEAGSFSLKSFYERRARRILPALFLVTACSCVAAWFLLIPPDMEEFARSVSYVPFFLSNVFFYQLQGYFGSQAELAPLLHTWSLAVEEQYYLLFPLLLMFLLRRARILLPWAFLLLAAGSLAASEWMLRRDPDEVFFLLQFRLWELLIGAGIAWWAQARRLPTVAAGSLASLGLLLIVLPVFVFDSGTRFPGVHALLPAAGAALVLIYAGPGNFVGRMLAWWPLVGVGLISYSVYLWHQPVFAFVRHASFEAPTAGVMLVATAGSFGLAYASWRFVEQPFRRPGVVSRGRLIGLAVGLALAALVFGMQGRSTDGYEDRVGVNVRFPDMTYRLRHNHGLSHPCYGNGDHPRACRTDDEPEVLLWGDSYAMHLGAGLVAEKPDIRLVQYTRPSCGPIPGVAPLREQDEGLDWAEKCIAHNDGVLRFLESAESIRYVLLGSPFHYYFQSNAQLATRDGTLVSGQSAGLDLLRENIARLQAAGKQVAVMAPPPLAGADYGRCVARAALLGVSAERCDFPRVAWERYRAETIAALRELEGVVRVIWLADGICPEGLCRASMDGAVIYRDNGHLTYEGARLLAQKMGWYRQLTAPFEAAATERLSGP